MVKMFKLVVSILTLVGGLFAYVNANYYDKDDVDGKFTLIERTTINHKKITCALIKGKHDKLYQSYCLERGE